jgi:hypothetical protein
MKKTLLTAFILLTCVAGAFSQVDAKYKATLKKMFEVSGSKESFEMVVVQMTTMMKQDKQIPDEIWAELEKEILSTSLDQLAEMLTPVYQKHLTEADLNEIIKFYQTPVGTKFASKNPVIMQESMQVGQQWGMQIGQQVAEKLRAKGY